MTRAPLKIDEKVLLVCAALALSSLPEIVLDNPGVNTTMKSEQGSWLFADCAGRHGTEVLVETSLARSAFEFACAGRVFAGSNLELVDGLAFIFCSGEFPEFFELSTGLEGLRFFGKEGFV